MSSVIPPFYNGARSKGDTKKGSGRKKGENSHFGSVRSLLVPKTRQTFAGYCKKRDKVAKEQQREIEQQRQELARNRELLEELKRQNIEARETERGVVVNLPDVLFEFGKADLTGDARAKTRDIAGVLSNQAQGRRISVEGHTDSVGSDAYNQQLSERRAQTVASALENTGVSNQRVTTKGYGKRYPVVPNTNPDGTDSPAGRAKNRRVEVVVEN